MSIYGFDRKHVSEHLILLANEIDRRFCYGRRQNDNGLEDNFIIAFFVNCSKAQRELLNHLAESEKMEDEILVEFFCEREDSSPSVLSEEEKRSWDFSRPWEAQMMCCSWDELREIPQPILAITYTI